MKTIISVSRRTDIPAFFYNFDRIRNLLRHTETHK